MHDWKRYVREHLGDLGLTPEREAEIVEELAQDFEARFTDLIAGGLSESEALAQIGQDENDWLSLASAIGETKRGGAAERLRSMEPPHVSSERLQRYLDETWRDIRFVARSLSKNRGFAAIAVASLALGVGANATVFSILNQVLFKPLPYPNGERLVMISEQNPKGMGQRYLQTGKMFALREYARSFESITQVYPYGRNVTLLVDGVTDQAAQQGVDIGVFETFDVKPQIGRLFAPDDIEPGGRSVAVVISDRLWKRLFGGTPDALGKNFEVQGETKTVIGVMPPGFGLAAPPDSGDIWRAVDETDRPKVRGLPKFALLRDGVSIEQAQSEADAIAADWDAKYGDDPDNRWPLVIISVREFMYGYAAEAVWMLQAAVALVLLIACVNVANMMLARGAVRQRELTIRTALGAGRKRIARLLLTESLTLGLMGGVGGVFVALAGIEIYQFLAPDSFPLVQEMRIDGQVLLFMAGISIAASLLFGIVPLLQVSKLGLHAAIKEGGREQSPGMSRRARNALLVSELALATALLGCTGLLVSGLLKEARADWGYRTRNILTTFVSLDGPRYLTRYPGRLEQSLQPGTRDYFTTWLEKVRAIPGVESAGIGSVPTFFERPYPIEILGRPKPSTEADQPAGSTYEVDPGYFDTLQIPLLRGRYISEEDGSDAQWVAVVDRTFADRYFPSADPIGQTILISFFSPGDNVTLPEPKPREIVGVVDAVRSGYWVSDPPARVYYSYLQNATDYPGVQHLIATQKTLFVRANSSAVAEQIRDATAEIDSTRVLGSFGTLEESLARTLSGNRFYSSVLGLFATLAVLLAIVGIYGVISFSVNQRRNEFGVRMALGAQRGRILGLVLGEAISPTAVGLAIGVAATFAFRRYVDSLTGLTAFSPATVAAITLVLAIAAVTATVGPARRAASVEPMEALRHD